MGVRIIGRSRKPFGRLDHMDVAAWIAAVGDEAPGRAGAAAPDPGGIRPGQHGGRFVSASIGSSPARQRRVSTPQAAAAQRARQVGAAVADQLGIVEKTR